MQSRILARGKIFQTIMTPIAMASDDNSKRHSNKINVMRVFYRASGKAKIAQPTNIGEIFPRSGEHELAHNTVQRLQIRQVSNKSLVKNNGRLVRL